MWHVICDTWHMTRRDTWHVTCLGGLTFSPNFSFLALTVCDLWYYEDLEEKDDSINEWINKLLTMLFIEQPGLHVYTGSVKKGNYILCKLVSINLSRYKLRDKSHINRVLFTKINMYSFDQIGKDKSTKGLHFYPAKLKTGFVTSCPSILILKIPINKIFLFNIWKNVLNGWHGQAINVLFLFQAKDILLIYVTKYVYFLVQNYQFLGVPAKTYQTCKVTPAKWISKCKNYW